MTITYRMKGKNHIDSLKFALFISLLNSIYKGVLCLMRRFTKNERLNAAVAGGLSSLSLLVDSKDRRIFFALVFIARSFVIELIFIKLLRTLYWICFRREGCSKSSPMERSLAGQSWAASLSTAWAVSLNASMIHSEDSIISKNVGFINNFRYSAMTRNDTELCLVWSSMADAGKIWSYYIIYMIWSWF